MSFGVQILGQEIDLRVVENKGYFSFFGRFFIKDMFVNDFRAIFIQYFEPYLNK